MSESKLYKKRREAIEKLQSRIDSLEADIKVLGAERNVMAMLASDEPKFFNTIGIFEAKKLRDRILRNFRP